MSLTELSKERDRACKMLVPPQAQAEEPHPHGGVSGKTWGAGNCSSLFICDWDRGLLQALFQPVSLPPPLPLYSPPSKQGDF